MTDPATTPDAPLSPQPARRLWLDPVLALGAGGLLTLMVLLNGEMARATTPLFASWAAHGTGALAAFGLLALLARRRPPGPAVSRPRAPLWAYLGGLSGAITVILTSATVNSVLALTGTLALGLLGQVLFGLASDRFGLFGLPRRRPGLRDLAALALILAGSALIIFSGRG